MVMDSYDTCSNNQHQRDQHQHYQEQQQQQQDDCQQQQQSNKRSCGTAANPAPGQLPADQVAKYLHSLSAHLNNRQLEHASMVLTTEGWQVGGSCGLCSQAAKKLAVSSAPPAPSHLLILLLSHALLLLHPSPQAFAELNLLLSNCLESGMLPGHLMRSYSRFTLQTRAALWQRYSSYVAGKDTLSPQQLELLRFLLEFVLAP